MDLGPIELKKDNSVHFLYFYWYHFIVNQVLLVVELAENTDEVLLNTDAFCFLSFMDF